MPALGARGTVTPKELAKAKAAPAKPIAKLPGTPTRPTSSLPTSTAHTGQSKVPGPPPAHHALLSLHTLEEGAKAVGGAALGAVHSAYGEKGAKGAKGTMAPGAAIASPVSPSLEKAAGKDVVQLGELPFVGGLKVGEAGYAALTGNLKPAGELGKGIVEGVKHGALGELAQGHLEGAKKAFQEHPLFTVAESGGLSGVAGRGAGAALRAAGTQAEKGGVGGALARAGSTVRPPIALTDEAALAKQGLVKQRTYSKDSLRKGVQVMADKRRQPVLDANNKPVTIKDRGRTVPVLKATGREQEKLQAQRANFESSRTQAVEQLERDKARKTANTIEGRVTPRPSMRLGHEMSQLVASGTIRTAGTFKQDLQKRIKTIEDAIAHPEHYRTEGTKASPGELQAARQNLQLLQKAARNPAILKNAPQIVENGLRYAEALNKGDQRLSALDVHPKAELDRAALSEYALAHMGARHGTPVGSTEPQLLGRDRQPLTSRAIREDAVEAGRHPDTLAYVPHIIGAGRKSSFHAPFRPGSRPVFGPHTRTGALYRRGATAVGTDLVRDELTKKGTVASNAEAIDKFIHESGMRRPDGKHFNAQEALEAANRLNADGTSHYVPVRAFAAKLPVEHQRALMEAQSPSQMETAHQAMLNDRIVQAGDNSKTRNVVLVPKHQVDTLMRQLRPPGEAERIGQLLNGPFRMAVLPQPRWLTGNTLEPYMVRLPLSGAGVNLPGSAVDFRAAEKAVRGMEQSGDPKLARAGKEIRGMQMGGMLIGRKGASVRRTYQDFPGDAGRVMYGAHVVRILPVLKQMGDLILQVPHTFFAVNRVIESTAQKIAFGKTLREDVQQITGSWAHTIMLGDKALAEARKGLVNTATQHRFMEEQYKMLGQYNGYNPTMRKLVQTAFPFLPWTLNSLRFVYWTLPASHTGAFTGLLKASQAVQAEWEAEHKDMPPGTLKDAVLQKDKGAVDISKYTPFGATIPLAQGEFQNLPSTFAPQLSGSQKALEGQDPFGRPLQVPKTAANPKGEPSKGQKIGTAVNSAAESMVPLLAMIRRLQEGGGTSYANSTVFSPKAKPETSHGMSAIDRTLNPFRPTYVKPKGGKGSRSKPNLGSSLGSGLGSTSLGSSLK